MLAPENRKTFSSLRELGTEMFLEGKVPKWAWPKDIGQRRSVHVDFIQRYVLMKVFQSTPLLGENITLEEYQKAPLGEMLSGVRSRSWAGPGLYIHLAKLYGCKPSDLTIPRPQTLDLHPWVGDWKETLRKHEKTPFTHDVQEFLNRLCVFARFEDVRGNKVDLYFVEQEHLRWYLGWLRRQVKTGHISVNTAHQKSVHLLQFATYVRKRYGTQDWVRRLQCLPQDHSVTRYWIPDQFRQESFFRCILRYAALPARDFALFSLMGGNGFRTGEVRLIEWQGVDFEQHLITFRQKGGKYVSLPLLKSTERALLLWKTQQKSPSRYVFTTSRGSTRLPQGTIINLMMTYALASEWNIETVRPYTWRHTFVTSLLKHTKDYTLVRTLARHETAWMTTRYHHPTEHDLRESGELIQRYLGAEEEEL